MLIDEVDIILKAGHGGAGRVSFNPGKKKGPNGGNGGKGGDILERRAIPQAEKCQSHCGGKCTHPTPSKDSFRVLRGGKGGVCSVSLFINPSRYLREANQWEAMHGVQSECPDYRSDAIPVAAEPLRSGV